MLKCRPTGGHQQGGKQNYFMKTHVGNESRNTAGRCRVACGKQSFVFDFLFLFDQAKRKTHSFFIIHL